MRIRSQNRKRRQRALGISSQIVEVLESRQLLASIVEFGGLTSGASPTSITQGPANDLWFVQSNRVMLGQFTPGVGLAEQPLGPITPPTSITLGPDGNLWYTRPTSDKIGRMTPTGTIATFDVTPGSAPHEIIVGPDGNLWFTEPGNNKIGKITTTGDVTEYGGMIIGSQPTSLTVGPDGNIWFTEVGTHAIGSIVVSGPNAGTLTQHPLSGGLIPGSIATGADGNLWFTDTTNNLIGQFTPGGTVTTFTLPTSNASPEKIISGPGGDLYFTMSAGNAIGRISVSGLISEYTVPTLASSPTGITVGPDGHVWFTEAAADKLGRLNLEPTTLPDSYTVYQNLPLVVNAANGVLANDNDPESDAVTAVVVSQPTHGSVALNSDGSFTYTPNSGYFGSDSFTYKANDGTDDSSIAAVILTIRPETAPVAVNDTYATYMDAPLTVNAANGVLANDTDAESDPITAILIDQPLHGYVSLNADGSFTFTPFPAFTGTDSFTYKVNDGSLDGNTATVNFTVHALPTGAPNSYTVAVGSGLTVDAANGVLANDTGGNGTPLTAVKLTDPAHGSLTFNANGSFTYIPVAGYAGFDSFTYKPTDGTAEGEPVTVTIKVNARPVGVGDSYTATQDTVLTVNATLGVLANDTDANNDTLTANIFEPPSHGTLVLNPDGSFTYTPNAGYFGPDSFTYQATDGRANSGLTTVSIRVNAPPVSVGDSYTLNQDGYLSTTLVNGVLVNDTDPDANPLTAIKVSNPAHGALTFNADGTFLYTPDAGYHGPDSFTYKANDGTDDGNIVTVNITVNALPVAVGDSYTATRDSLLSVNAANGVLANDTDADADTLIAIKVADPSHGSVTLYSDGSFNYLPNTGYVGPDSFIYKVNDGTADGNTVTVSINVNAPPVSVDDSYATPRNVNLTIDAASGVLANDTDDDGDGMTAVKVTDPSHGSLTLNANGSFTYIPTAGYQGPDSFTYQANDGTADGNIVTVNITVGSAPVSADDAYRASSSQGLIIGGPGVLYNDADADGDAMIAVKVTDPAHGTLTIYPNGSFIYSPNPGYVGPDSFTYQADDGDALGNVATVSINVNTPPLGDEDHYTVNQDSTLTVNAASGVLANDTDADADALSVIKVSDPAHGVLTLNFDGSFTYTPDAGYVGPDSFTYKPHDGLDGGELVTVHIKVNAPPVGADDYYTVNQDSVLVATGARSLLANDSDADGDPMVTVTFTQPSHGVLELDHNGEFLYTPAPGYSGPDSFTYTPNDGFTDGNTVTVYINVNAPPVSVGDSYATPRNIPLTVNAGDGVLINDADPDANPGPLTAVLVDDVSHGALTFNADGSFTYTPTTGYQGPDSFTYKTNDGSADGNIVTVNITVGSPPVSADDNYTVARDQSLVIGGPGILLNDTDADGDEMTAVLVGGPAHGSLTLYPNGSFEYTPNLGYFGPDSFTYMAFDGSNYSAAAATVHIKVNAPPVGVDDSYTVNQDSALTVNAAGGVLANDTDDDDGDTLTAVLFEAPAHGSLNLNADGSFTYTPDAGYFGHDDFTYTVNDGSIDSDLVTVHITVNAPPVGADDHYSVAQDAVLTVDASNGVLANDNDADADPLSAVLVDAPAHGSLTFNADGSFTYTPDAGYFGHDDFTYRANDGTTNGNLTTVHITVNAPPVGVDDNYTVDQDSTLTVNAANGVLANDTDGNGDALTATLVDAPAHGVLTLNPDGSFIYTPDAGYVGHDDFTYKANDGTADGGLTTVHITVNHVNHAPTAAADAFTTAENAFLTVSAANGVLANDSDPDGNPITAVLVDGPSHGTLTLNPDGSFVYLPATNFNGADSFRYQAHDGTIGGNIVTVSLTVTPVNQDPSIVPVNLNATQGTPLNGVVVATFTDPDADEYPGSFTAVINWGDGSAPTTAQITRSGNVFTVKGDHVYNSYGSFNVTITVTDPAGGVSSQTGMAAVAARVNPPVDPPVDPPADPPSTPLTGEVQTAGQAGPLGVPVTSNNSPTIRGTGPAGQVVTLYAVASGPMAVGQAVIGVDGTYQITSAAMPDGTYTLAVAVSDPARPGSPPSAVQWLGALTIDTAPPVVTGAHYDTRTRQFFVSFQDLGSGLDLNTVLDTANYLVAISISRTSRGNIVPLTGARLASFGNGSATVAISVGDRPWLRRGHGLFAAFSQSITDRAGNALAGQFSGYFPTGGPAGTNFVTRYPVIGRQIAPPQPAPFLTRISPRWVNRLRRIR